jgi:hypothetical protein
MTVLVFDVVPDTADGHPFLGQPFSVTRYIDAKLSTVAMVVQDRTPLGVNLFDKTVQVARVSGRLTTAITGDVHEHVGLLQRKKIRFSYLRRSILESWREFDHRRWSGLDGSDGDCRFGRCRRGFAR